MALDHTNSRPSTQRSLRRKQISNEGPKGQPVHTGEYLPTFKSLFTNVKETILTGLNSPMTPFLDSPLFLF